jgi:hypothetical protein
VVGIYVTMVVISRKQLSQVGRAKRIRLAFLAGKEPAALAGKVNLTRHLKLCARI